VPRAISFTSSVFSKQKGKAERRNWPIPFSCHNLPSPGRSCPPRSATPLRLTRFETFFPSRFIIRRLPLILPLYPPRLLFLLFKQLRLFYPISLFAAIYSALRPLPSPLPRTTSTALHLPHRSPIQAPIISRTYENNAFELPIIFFK
jgi:hypothetical protein